MVYADETFEEGLVRIMDSREQVLRGYVGIMAHYWNGGYTIEKVAHYWNGGYTIGMMAILLKR